MSRTSQMSLTKSVCRGRKSGRVVSNSLKLYIPDIDQVCRPTHTQFVGGQKHSLIKVRAPRGFSGLWDQVLVLISGQELGPFAENGQEHGTITDFIIN